MTSKELDTNSYGICLFSLDVMQEFLQKKRVHTRKVLGCLQKKKRLYLSSIEKGAWFPVPGIDSVTYRISVAGYDDPFDEEWEELISYEGFNLEVKNGLWVSDMGGLLSFEPEEYQGEGRAVANRYGFIHYMSDKEQWYKDYQGLTHYTGWWYDVPDGKYLVTVKGYCKKNTEDPKETGCGFRFELTATDRFTECRNPRETDDYEFNIDWIKISRSAKVYWLPRKESGISWPVKEYRLKKGIVTVLENGVKVHLSVAFQTKDRAEEGVTRCRVKTTMKVPEGFELESGREYPIFEWTFKRYKETTKKIGILKVD